MAKCEHCGNDYKGAFEVTMSEDSGGDGKPHVFDSFECAIAALAPLCPTCGCRVIGHGVDANGCTFCCNHCAEAVHHVATS